MNKIWLDPVVYGNSSVKHIQRKNLEKVSFSCDIFKNFGSDRLSWIVFEFRVWNGKVCQTVSSLVGLNV